MIKNMTLFGSFRTKPLLVVSCILALIAFTCIISPDAIAAEPHPPGTCTHDPQFELPYASVTPGSGLISTIVNDIKNVTRATLLPLYFNLLLQGDVLKILTIAISLYIAVYGVLFTFGMLQSTVYDFFIRMIKIGVLVSFIHPASGPLSWLANLDILWYFFITGTDAVIAEAMNITVGGVSAPYNPNAPFAILDTLIATAVSGKMAVTILATVFTGPYGILFAILLLMSLGSLLRALLTALWVYLMSLVLKTLLIALSPIFIGFILFNRTRHLFEGWLNQLLNASLQPIFIFIFFAFFVALIQTSMDNLLKNPVCWTEWADSVRGTPFAVHYWRFAIDNPRGSGTNWEPYGGLWSFQGIPGQDPNLPVFPLDILHILIFLVLAELAGRFNNIVIMIASDIAGASSSLASMQGPLAGWMGGGGGRNTSPLGALGNRNTPGGVTPTSGNAAAGMANWNRQVADEGTLGAVSKQIQNLTGRR